MAEQPIYAKVGRGGAGNFYSKGDEDAISKGKVVSDLEAQPLPAEDVSESATSSHASPEYLHTGRGGAGNWVKPAEATSSSASNIPAAVSDSAPSASKRETGGSKPAYRAGRGGAGNYIDPAHEEKLKREEEDKIREEMEGRIQSDVEAGLARPEKAYGGVGGAYEMGSMG